MQLKHHNKYRDHVMSCATGCVMSWVIACVMGYAMGSAMVGQLDNTRTHALQLVQSTYFFSDLTTQLAQSIILFIFIGSHE